MKTMFKKASLFTLNCGVILLLATVGYATAYASALDDPASRISSVGGAGGLAPVVPEIDAGKVTVGASAQVVMRFKNEGGKEIKISSIDLYPSSTVSATISVDDCSKVPVAAGSECAVVVTVKGVKTGNWRVEALVRHDAKSRITTASMKGDVDAGENSADKLLSDIEVIPDEIDFGSLTSGRPLVKSVILRNVTSDPIEVTNIKVTPDTAGYSINSDCAKLLPAAACAVALTWAPTAKGQAEGILMVEHTGATKVASLSIKGNYNPDSVSKANIFPEAVAGKGLLVASQEAIDFGSVDNEASITVSLVNVGDTDLTLGKIDMGGVENGLSVSHNGCKPGLVLKPVEACPLTLSWSAVRAGAILDDIQIYHDGARGVLVLPVRGNATTAVNRDSKAVVVETTTPGKAVESAKPVDKSQALEGFVISSLSGKKAIINGPGGSRVISNNQQIVLGGVQWIVDINQQGVDFSSGHDRVRLLFDRSLSSVNRTNSQSSSAGSGSGTATSASAASSSSSSSAAPTTAP